MHSPLVAGDLLLVATQEPAQPPQRCVLRAFDLADAGPRWQQSFDYALVSGLGTFRVSGEPSVRLTLKVLVALSSTDVLRGQGALLALSTSGQEAWRWSPGVQKVSAPASLGDAVYVTADARTLLALDARTGQERARVELVESASLSAPALSGGVAYIPCRSPHLLAITLDGKLLWRFTIKDSPDAWLDKTPVVANQNVYAVSSQGAVVAVRANDGALVWQQDLRKALSPPATDGERLYVGARDGIHALDLSTGGPVWTFPTERRIEAAPVAMGGVVYCAGHDHRVYALDAATGRELWRHEMQRRIEVTPVVTQPDHALGACVIVADHGGILVLLQRPLSASEHEAAGHWGEAASAYADLGQPARGAELLESHGEPFKAAELWKAGGELERAATQYEVAQAWQPAAEIWKTLRRALKQAEALEQFARSLEGKVEGKEGAAEWEVAARAFDDEGELERASACRREVARCLRLPVITVQVKHEGLVQEAWSQLQFILRNEGYGPARNLIIRATGEQFQGQVMATQQIATLKSGQERVELLDVRPLQHGPSVPLRVSLECEDSSGELRTQAQTIHIAVARTEADRGSAQVIHIDTGGGMAIVGSTVSTGGDMIGRDKSETRITGEGNVVGDGSSSSIVKTLPSAAEDMSAGPAAQTWNTSAVRDLLTAALSDEELTAFCSDHFSAVYEDLSAGMSKGQKVQRLLDHCLRRDQVGELLRLVQEYNPVQYARFKDRLEG